MSGDTLPIFVRAQTFLASNTDLGIPAINPFPISSYPMTAAVRRHAILRPASSPTGSRFILFGNPDEKAQRFIHRVRRRERDGNVRLYTKQ